MKDLRTTFWVLILLLASSPKSMALVFDMAPLEFTNRAACADLSTKPARSIFLQLDAFNAGKAGYATGLSASKILSKTDPKSDPQYWSSKGVRDFRILSSHLAYTILEGLKSGKLPLLDPEGLSPLAYKEVSSKCLKRNQFLSCNHMNDLLSEWWSRSKMEKPHWEELGLNESDFFPRSMSTNARIGCHIVRKFSAFHSPLKTQEVTDGVIDNIAIDAYNPTTSIDSCFSLTDAKDTRFTTLQLDLANLSPEREAEWDAIGFKFWHSFKLFYSWGFRYAPEYVAEYGQLRQAFSSIALEDSLMILPNGCRSVEMPKCDSEGLSSDVLRAAKMLGATHPAVSELPQKPIDTLFTGRASPVNNDSLELFKAENASAWGRDFKDKLSGLRFDLQRKLNTGISRLQVMTSLISSQDIADDLQTILNDDSYDRNETFLTCMEYSIAKNSLFQDIANEISTLKNADELKSVLLKDTGKNLEKYVTFYQEINNKMEGFCKALESKGRARAATNDPDLYKALNEWAFDILRPNEKASFNGLCLKNPTHPACPKNLDKTFLTSHLRETKGDGQKFTICRTSLECARMALDSLVSVVSVRRYAHAFLPLDDIMKSPDLFNNYANPVACHLYDPWSKKRNAWKLFIADLGSALLQGASCGAFQYRVLDLPKDNVIAFKEIYDADTNEMNYSPITKHEDIKYVAGIDYAFLPGLSCGATVSNILISQSSYTLPGYYAEFEVKKCEGTASTDYTVDKNAKIDLSFNRAVQTDKDVSDTCFRCNIGLKALAQSACAVPYVGQIASATVGLFQGLLRLVSNFQDNDNIPDLRQLNVDQITVGLDRAPTNLKLCHNDLKRGMTCSDTK